MSFSIFTDTSANLPTELTEQNGITVAALSYTMDGETKTCTDTRSFDAPAYYAAMKQGAVITTSQVNPQQYVDVMEPALKAGQDILFVGMSSGISGSLNSARIAADQLLETYPDRTIAIVDSLGASLGEGLWVLKACDYNRQGMTAAQAAEKLEAQIQKMYQLFTVDDLMHLRKGGRLSNAAAIFGTLLQVKPLLKGNAEGKIVAFEKVRGRKGVLEKIAQRYDEMVTEPENQIVGISHCGCPEDAAAMAKRIQQNRPPRQVLVVEHEPVTGSYLGPGALAIYFTGAQGIREK